MRIVLISSFIERKDKEYFYVLILLYSKITRTIRIDNR